ncbi:MAG: family 20 glycosylhydrolase [Flavobacteriales bacterium]
MLRFEFYSTLYTMKNLLFALLTTIAFTACNETEVKLTTPPSAKDLAVNYEMVSNTYEKKDQSLNKFDITNNATGELKANWTIYFNQTRVLVDNSVKGDVKVTRINGDYYKVEPSASYKPVPSKGKLSFTFLTEAWIIKNADFPCGFYIVFKDSTGKEMKPEVLANITYAPLVKPEHTNRIPQDNNPVPTAESRYEKNLLITSLKEEELCPILPTPSSFKREKGEFKISGATTIFYDKALRNEALYLQGIFKKLLRSELPVQEGKGNGIELRMGAIKLDKASPDAYAMKISDKGVVISSFSSEGTFYGIQSLRALIPTADYAKNVGSTKVPAVQITDAPKFAYRGMFLDVARNFQSKESVLRLLDLMSFYKLNKFHFHLMDDEGWRIEIKALPELTEVGSKRGHTKDESDMLNPTCGSGPFADAKKSNGTGFYTQEEFIEILEYAADRHIEVIPEIDFPGHARAAIISMKARYNKYIKTDAAKANEFLLHDPKDASKYHTEQHYNDNVVCVAQESVYKFLDTVVAEIQGLYEEAGLDLRTVHTGGDEVPHPTAKSPETGAWVKSPVCIDFMNKSDKYKTPRDLFYYFVARYNKILSDRGITTGGWEEIGLHKQSTDSTDIITPNMDFANKNVMPYVWNTVWGWGDEDKAYKLANAGFKVVLSNVSNLYFDLAVDKDPLENGYYWGGFVDLKRTWSFLPLNYSKGITTDRMGIPLAPDYMKKLESLTPKGKGNIIGIQGQLWAETVKGKELMEYMIFPRMIALAERAWNGDPNWKTQSDEDRDWNKFVNTLGKYDLPRLDYYNRNSAINYRIPLPGAKIENDSLYANIEIPGFTILYSTDNKSWEKYHGPVPVKKGTIYLKAASAKGRESRVMSVATK